MNLHRAMRACAGLLLAGALAATAIAAPGAAPANGGLLTRGASSFLELEQSLLAAQRSGKPGAERFVTDDFQMVLAQDGGAVVPREDWLESVGQPGSGQWVVSQFTVHVFGDVAVAGFVLRPDPKRSGARPLALVDTWRKAGDEWRLALRHVAEARGPRAGVPGDAPTRAVIRNY